MASKRRAVQYCIVPEDLAARLHEPLRRHFGDDSSVEVVVEHRWRDRRARRPRRVEDQGPPEGDERRRIRAADGRRVAQRRATAIAVEAPEAALPRRARAFADRIVFVERLVPTAQDSEDAETDRLVVRIQRGEDKAFAELYMRYFDRVYRYLHIALRDEHEAEDVTQQVFMRVLEALPRYELRGRPFRAWLFVIVRNTALDQLRKRGLDTDLVAPEELERTRDTEMTLATLPGLDWVSDRELIMLVERLPLAQRQVLLLRFAVDLTAAQTASVLGYTPDNVRQLQGRALEFLRERLAGLGRTAPRGGRIRMRAEIKPALVIRARRFALTRW